MFQLLAIIWNICYSHKHRSCCIRTHIVLQSDTFLSCIRLLRSVLIRRCSFNPLYDVTFNSCRKIMWPAFIYYARNFQSHTYTYIIRQSNKFINDRKEYKRWDIVYLYINIKYYNEEWKEMFIIIFEKFPIFSIAVSKRV